MQVYTFVLKHKYGVSNKVIDALCRRSSLLTKMHSEVLECETFQELILTDPCFYEIMSAKIIQKYVMKSIWEGIRHYNWF